MPDQTYLGNQSELLPFFGEPAVTNTATSKLAAISGAAVLPVFLPALAGAAITASISARRSPICRAIRRARDAQRLFGLLEEYIRLAPEQYLWLYKKFKGRPAPFPDAYAR